MISILLALLISGMKENLFVFIQTLYAFFAPPFSAIFLLGIISRRINAKGATVSAFLGFVFAIAIKLYVRFVHSHPMWIEPYEIQSIFNWAFCVAVCVIVSLLTKPPEPHKISDTLTLNIHKFNIFTGLGEKWYSNVVLWWGIYLVIIILLIILFSDLVTIF